MGGEEVSHWIRKFRGSLRYSPEFVKVIVSFWRVPLHSLVYRLDENNVNTVSLSIFQHLKLQISPWASWF